MLAWFFFFNDTATTEIYTLSLHDALPISPPGAQQRLEFPQAVRRDGGMDDEDEAVIGDLRDRREVAHRVEGQARVERRALRSEEHTSELQSRQYLVCRLLLENKKDTDYT